MKKREHIMLFSHTFYWGFQRPKLYGKNIFVERIPSDILSDIINNNISLNIHLVEEGDIDDTAIKLVETQLTELGISYENVSFTHCCYKFPTTKINAIFSDMHFNLKSKQAFTLNNTNKLFKGNDNKRKYKFHIPNRRLRNHRIKLLQELFLYDNNFIDNNLVSFDIDVYSNTEELNKYIKNQKFAEWIFSKKQRRIDESNMITLDGYNSEFINVYEDSYITIITETFFYENFYYMSEKTYKPIMHHHPFIVFGRPFSLQYLKDIGFKTFHPFINEEYDNIENNTDRFNAILHEIKRLDTLSKDELHDLNKNLNDILVYNQNLLIERGKNMFKNKFM